MLLTSNHIARFRKLTRVSIDIFSAHTFIVHTLAIEVATWFAWALGAFDRHRRLILSDTRPHRPARHASYVIWSSSLRFHQPGARILQKQHGKLDISNTTDGWRRGKHVVTYLSFTIEWCTDVCMSEYPRFNLLTVDYFSRDHFLRKDSPIFLVPLDIPWSTIMSTLAARIEQFALETTRRPKSHVVRYNCKQTHHLLRKYH
jgi:hypothetical protein